MLSFSGSLRIFVALEPCDMRKGEFNGVRPFFVCYYSCSISRNSHSGTLVSEGAKFDCVSEAL